jgi:hypothetical protein
VIFPTIERDGCFSLANGWVDAPGGDLAKLPRNEIELLFILISGERNVVEVGRTAESRLTDEYGTHAVWSFQSHRGFRLLRYGARYRAW